MRRRTSPDHLSSSLTDLMTSLAVIFILLLVAKLNNQATRTDRSMTYVVSQLDDRKLFNGGEKMRRDGDVLVVAIPQELMSFKQATAEHGGADLSAQGKEYLRATIPKLAAVLCRDDVRRRIDTILVEGHSDKKGFGLGKRTSRQTGEPETQPAAVDGCRCGVVKHPGNESILFSRLTFRHRSGRCAALKCQRHLQSGKSPGRASDSSEARCSRRRLGQP